MNIKIKTRSEAAKERYDYNDRLSIEIDGKQVFHVHDGEVEDNYLFRNFSDMYDIGYLLEQAYEAGKNGEELVIEHEETNEW